MQKAFVVKCQFCGKNIAGYDASRSDPAHIGKAVAMAAETGHEIGFEESGVTICLGKCCDDRVIIDAQYAALQSQ